MKKFKLVLQWLFVIVTLVALGWLLVVHPIHFIGFTLAALVSVEIAKFNN